MTQNEINGTVRCVTSEAPEGHPCVTTEIDSVTGIVSFWYSWKENDDAGVPERRLELCFGNGVCVLRLWLLLSASDYCIEINSMPIRFASQCINTFWHTIMANQ